MEEERQKDNINQLHERLVKLKKKILSGTSVEEKKKILSDFDWNHYREYSVKILMIKREVIIEQKKEGKEKFDLWLADIKEWEKKNMNNYDDNLKSKYYLKIVLSQSCLEFFYCYACLLLSNQKSFMFETYLGAF